MTVVEVLVALLVLELGIGLVLAFRVLTQLRDRQRVFNEYAKAVGRDSLRATREAEKAVAKAQALSEDAHQFQRRVSSELAEFRRGR